MKRITLHLQDGSSVSIVSDEITRVSIGDATLGPARVTIHHRGEDEAGSWRTPDLIIAAMRAVTGAERIDADPLPASSSTRAKIDAWRQGLAEE